jgi:hypothetical protein
MRVDIHVHLDGPININISPSDEAPTWAEDILDGIADVITRLGRVERKENNLMTSVADIQAKADTTLANITAETDQVRAVKLVVEHSNELIASLKQQLADAIAAGVDPAAVQKLSDTIDAIQASQMSNAQVVADAVAEGTVS